jgi:hypothetical protein
VTGLTQFFFAVTPRAAGQASLRLLSRIKLKTFIICLRPNHDII